MSEQELSSDWFDIEVVKKLNGLFTNRLFVQHLGDGLLRLNFGDMIDPEEPSYHTALVITARNAAEFAQLIYQNALIARPAASGEGGAQDVDQQ